MSVGRTTIDRPLPPRDPVAALARGVEPTPVRIETPPPSRGAAPIAPRRAPVAARTDGPEAFRLPDAAGRASREPDVVRVHIGRVEVRAILPPAERPAPKPRGPAGPLPLDRYLARKARP